VSRPEIGAAELVSLAGLTAVTLVLIQIERLVIPRRLSLDDLALFGVLAAVAASPYRVLQQGVGYTLLPRLRAAGTAAERRALLLREAQVSVGATLLASALIWALSRPVVSWWLAGKYELSAGLLLAAIAAGFAKVASAFATAAATALCTERELERLRVLAWLALAAAFAGCIAGARFGLIGVVGGAGVGWLCFAAAAGFLAAPHLRDPGRRPRKVSVA
jgi:O-antigen/teichoic acid export membrane protein